MRLKQLLSLFLLIITLCSINLAQANPDWFKPFPPFRIAGNLYYVGSKDLASYLIVTSKGSILINSDYEANVPMIKASIEKLGFKFSDIKIILTSQAHIDHAAASALIKKQTGASYMVMAGDVSVAESGGKTDFLFGNDPSIYFQPTKVDRVLHDGSQVKLGDTILVAHLTPGHTKGCTTWTMKVAEKGKMFDVVIIGGVSINPGTKLINNPAYPGIVKDYEHMWEVSKTLPCDIFLGAHGVYFGLLEKYARMQKGTENVFVDPDGYKQFIAQKEQEFKMELAKQQTAIQISK